MFLGFAMVMMMVVMVMVNDSGENRAGKHRQQQCGGENLLHGQNLARPPLRRYSEKLRHQDLN
jgi:hypothetical protein